MKRLFILILMFLTGLTAAYSQSAKDRIKESVKNQDYIEAANYINQALRENPKDENVFVLCGDVLFELEKLDSALILYLKADDINRDEAQIMRKIGRTYSHLGNHQQAIKILKDAIKEFKDDVYVMLELGMAYIKADSLRQAELIITKAREMNKSIADGWVALGDLYFAQKVYELARTNYEEALSIDEDLTDARVKLATAYYWLAVYETDPELYNELFTRSLKEWNTVTQKDPKNARAFYEQGKILFMAKKWEEAAKSFYQYTILRPSGSLGRWYLAQSMFELGQCDSAAPQLKIVAKEIDSVKNKATLMLAQCYFDNKRFPESIQEYKLLYQQGILEIKDMKRFAAALFREGDTTQGLVVYKDIINKDHSECLLMYQLGSLMVGMKNYTEAIYFYQKRLAFCNDSITPKTLYYVGICYLYLEKADSAYSYLKKSQDLDPKYLNSSLYLADVYSKLGNPDSAKITLRFIIDNGMKDTAIYARELLQAYAKLCGLLLEEKNIKEVQKLAKQWTDYDPKSQYAWLYYGISCQALEDVEGACKSYRKVLAIDPKNKTAKDALGKLPCP